MPNFVGIDIHRCHAKGFVEDEQGDAAGFAGIVPGAGGLTQELVVGGHSLYI